MFCRKVNLPKKANWRNVKKNCFCNGKRWQYYFMLQLLFTKNIKVIRHLKLVINVATYSKHFLSLSLSLSVRRCIGKNFFPRQLQTKYRWKTINKVLLHYGKITTLFVSCCSLMRNPFLNLIWTWKQLLQIVLEANQNSMVHCTYHLKIKALSKISTGHHYCSSNHLSDWVFYICTWFTSDLISF